RARGGADAVRTAGAPRQQWLLGACGLPRRRFAHCRRWQQWAGSVGCLPAMSDQLTALDATFLELEQMDEGATMHIGGVLVFDPLPDGTVPALEAVCTDIASRLTLLPRFSQRLSAQRTGGLTWPRWVDDPQFDIRNHVHRAALPAPGGDIELCEWAADF